MTSERDTVTERGHGLREGTRPRRGTRPQRGSRPQKGTWPRRGDMASERGHGLREWTRPQRGDTASERDTATERGHGHGERTRPWREDTASEREHSLGEVYNLREGHSLREGTWPQRGDTVTERFMATERDMASERHLELGGLQCPELTTRALMQLLRPQYTASPQTREVEATPRKSPAYEDGQRRRETTAQNATPRWGKTQATRQNGPMRCDPITESTGRRNRQRTARRQEQQTARGRKEGSEPATGGTTVGENPNPTPHQSPRRRKPDPGFHVFQSTP